jgi:hypothetical protein
LSLSKMEMAGPEWSASSPVPSAPTNTIPAQKATPLSYRGHLHCSLYGSFCFPSLFF